PGRLAGRDARTPAAAAAAVVDYAGQPDDDARPRPVGHLPDRALPHTYCRQRRAGVGRVDRLHLEGTFMRSRCVLVALVALVVCAATASTALADDSYTSTTVLTVTPTSAGAGQPVTFTALVTTDNGGAAPAGIVNFASGGVTFATAPLEHPTGSSATATATSNAFPNGTFAITATYKSDQQFVYFGSMSAPVTLTVAPTLLHTTQLALSATPASISVGQSATFKATVTPTDGSTTVPTGD